MSGSDDTDQERRKLILRIQDAFKDYKCPGMHFLIDPHFDTSINSEAAAVAKFVSTIKDKTIGDSRAPEVYDALIYLSLEAMTFYLPIAVRSLLEHFDDGEHLFSSVYYALRKEPVLPEKKRRYCLMSHLAAPERHALCAFSRLIADHTKHENVRDQYSELVDRWCEPSDLTL